MGHVALGSFRMLEEGGGEGREVENLQFTRRYK